MDASTNALNWFELPANDLDRAKTFYESIFKMEMGRMENEGMVMYVFPMDMASGKVSGGIVKSEIHHVSKQGGPIIYLNANPNISDVISRIEKAGGKVTMPKTEIGGGIGFMAMFVDSEGNAMGLHANG